ncbi:MAG: hypothetical protein LBK67_13605 [Coriobacteriales bacterium]|jgi:hypothetical protein|nr:hypothetical protein [Coriobacteriales bacterium]
MATSSIFNTIRVSDKKTAQCLVDAMAVAEQAKANEKPEPVKAKELKGDDLRRFFEER